MKSEECKLKQKAILSDLTAYQQGKQTHEIKEEYGLKRVVKLASNENVYGYSSKVRDYFKNELPDLSIYPDGHTSELRSALSKKLQVNEDELLFGSGSEEIIQIICRAFVQNGKNTVMSANSFSQYKHNTLIEGGHIKEVAIKEDGKHDLKKMSEAIDDDTVVVWICAPDNPTGTLNSEKELLEFMENCPKDVLVVLDEAYREYVDEAYLLDSLTYLSSYPNLITLRTFSKAYGLAGLRVGYAIGEAELIHHLNVVRGPFNTTSVAQKAATIALEDQPFIKETTKLNQKVKEDFYQFLNELEWDYYPTHTNFITVSTPISGMDTFDYLIKHGFVVRPGELLGYPNTVRITLGTKEDMLELQEALKKLNEQNR